MRAQYLHLATLNVVLFFFGVFSLQQGWRMQAYVMWTVSLLTVTVALNKLSTRAK